MGTYFTYKQRVRLHIHSDYLKQYKFWNKGKPLLLKYWLIGFKVGIKATKKYWRLPLCRKMIHQYTGE